MDYNLSQFHLLLEKGTTCITGLQQKIQIGLSTKISLVQTFIGISTKFRLVETQLDIPPVETPVGLPVKLSLVEAQIGHSISRI